MPIILSKLPRSVLVLTLFVCGVGLLSGSALSHTILSLPNGGESFTPGQVVEIQWVNVVNHNTAGWDLEYSLNGSAGPWLPIAIGLPTGMLFAGSSHDYSWTVPLMNSDSVRVRVTQVNSGTNYTDFSNSNFGVGDTLGSDVFTLSIQNGGIQTLTIDGGVGLAFNTYIVVGSASGSSPGFDINGLHVPLNDDFYLTATLQSTSLSPLANSFGALDSSGLAQAQVILPAMALSPAFAGLVLHHAAGIIDFTGSLTFVTNAAPLTLVP
ncbi:MAG: hypothetical protein V3W41_13565 [Planctomycetota bacterium]